MDTISKDVRRHYEGDSGGCLHALVFWIVLLICAYVIGRVLILLDQSETVVYTVATTVLLFPFWSFILYDFFRGVFHFRQYPNPPWENGSRVQVTKGPLEGHEGVIRIRGQGYTTYAVALDGFKDEPGEWLHMEFDDMMLLPPEPDTTTE